MEDADVSPQSKRNVKECRGVSWQEMDNLSRMDLRLDLLGSTRLANQDETALQMENI